MGIPRSAGPYRHALNELAEAQELHDQLKSDLPKYHGLRHDAEADARRLRKEGSSLDAQATARTRAIAAKQMLDDHLDEIADARDAVEACQRKADKAHRRQRLAELAKAATQAQQALQGTLDEAHRVVGEQVEKVAAGERAVSTIRGEWLDLAGEESELFRLIHIPVGWTDERRQDEQAKADKVLSDLEEQEIDYEAVLTQGEHERRRSALDLAHTKGVIWPKPYGRLIHTAVENRLNNPPREDKPE